MRSVRESPEPSYRDIKVSIRFPNGGVGEIIVASKFYDDVKFNRGGHEAYEVIRTIEAKWPNEDDIPRELKDVCADFRSFSEMIYSRGSSLEDIRMAYSSASASRTRLPSSNSLFGRQNSDVIGIPSSIKARKAEKQAELTKQVDEELRKSEIEEIVKANREIRKKRMSAILASRPELIPQLAKYNGPLSRSFASQIDDRFRVTSREEREYLLQIAKEWNAEIEKSGNATRLTDAETKAEPGFSQSAQTGHRNSKIQSQAQNDSDSAIPESTKSTPEVDRVDAEYEKRFGNVLNTDSAKTLIPGYVPSDLSSDTSTHKQASEPVTRLFGRWLKTKKGAGNGSVIFTGGGTGAGKSSILAMEGNKADFVFDSTMTSLDAARKSIQQVIDNGQDPIILFTYREPVDAWVNGIQKRVNEGGHVVSPETFARTHVESRKNALLLAEEFGDRIVVKVYENTFGKQPRQISLDELRAKKDWTKEEILSEIEKHDRATQSGTRTGNRPDDGTGRKENRGRLSGEVPGDSEEDGSGGRSQSRSTETGQVDQNFVHLDVPSRKRKIRTPDGSMEADVTPSFVPATSLIASDSKDYPQQFQPRDRAQNASSKAQIENAANNLDPDTLIQDSRGSETGAPKILQNGIVLSGNGRTMMIRRAHEKKLGGAYDEAVRRKAADMGLELPELKNGDYWVYVEKVDMSDEDAVKFAEHSNKNTILQRSAYEQAEADAKVMGADNELADAIAAVEASDDTQLRDGAFKEAATKFAISINASSEGLLDSNGNLTPRVYERMENAFIASLFETEQTQDARRHTRSIIERKTSGSGAGMMRAYNAVVRSAPALYRLSRLPAGKAGRDIRADVGNALSKYASLRSSGKTNQQIVDELSRQTMIPGTEDTSRVDSLVRNFADMARKNISISRFLGGYVRRAETAAYEPDMFGIPPVSTDELLQKAADEAMENQVTPRQDVNASPMPRSKTKKANAPQRTEQQKQKHKLAKKIASMAQRAGMNIHVLTGTEVREMSEASYGETTVNDLNIVPQTDLSNPENAEKFVSILNQYKGATPPHRLRNSDPQSAYKWFKDNLVGKTFNLGGRTFTVNEGHFFRFVCETPKDKSLRKGWISKAKSPEEARQMIEEGTISSSDIAGYVPARAATLPFALEALKSPDAIIRKPFNNTHKDTLIKKFDTNGKNSDIAVFILNGDGNTLGLATTHRRVITKQFINGNHLVAISDKVAKKSFSNPADEGLSLEDNAGDTSTSYEKNIQNPNNGVNSSSVRDGMLANTPYQTDFFDALKTAKGLNAFAKKNGLSKERKEKMKADVDAFDKALRDKTFSAFFDALRDGNPEQARLLQEAFKASPDGNTVSRILYDYFKARNTGIEHLKWKRVASAEDMAALFMTLRSPFVESFKVAFLDKDNRVLDIRVTSVGEIASAPASIVSTMEDIPEGAVSYIISHNHPSGDPDPSNQDQGVTTKFSTYAKEAFGLKMLDHIITNGKSFYSFQNGKIINFTTPHKESWEASDGTIKLDDVTKTEAFIKDNLRNGRDGKYIHVIYLNHKLKINAIRRIPVSEITKGGYIHSDTLKSAVFKDVGKFGADYLMIDACGLYGHNIGPEMRAVSTLARNTGLRVLEVTYKDEYSDFQSAAISARSMLAEDGQKYLTTSDGKVYGGVRETGELYLNEDGLDPDATISEYTRLWAESVKKNEPVLWEQGKRLFKKSEVWNQVKQETDLQTDDDIASEVLARLSGKNGSALIENLMETRGAKEKNPGKKEVEYLRNFWTNVKNQFMPWSKSENPEIDIRAFSLMPVADLVAGRNPMSDLSDRQFKIATSEKFIREHGNWMEAPESADIELDEHGEPVLDGNGTPMPKLSQAGSVRDGELEGRSVNLGNVADIESAGTGNHNTSVTREGIIQLVKTLFPNVAVEGKTTHKMRNALGWFEVGKGMIRLRNRGNTAVLMHELGHSIDEVCHVGAKPSNSMSDSVKIPTIIRQQMIEIGKGLYGSSKPAGGYASEGWAEFMKHYLIGNDESLRRQTPELLDWFLRTWAPQNKEVFGKLEKVRTAISNFKQQTPEETVRAFWSSKYPFSMKFAEWRERNDLTRDGLIYKWIDKKHFLYEQMKKAGVYVDYTDEKLPPEKVSKAIKNDPYLKATLYQGSSAAKTVQAVLEYTTDLSGVKRTGKSLSDALRPVRGKDKEFLKRFIDYAVARQALVYSERGLDSGLLESEAKQVVDKLQCKEYDEALQEVTDWSRRVLHLLVEGGAMTEDEFERIKQANPIYIKFLRNFKGELSKNGSSNLGTGGKPVHKRRGSTRDIENPIAAMILDVQKIIEAAQRADLTRSCATVAMRWKKGSSLGSEWMVDVPAPKDAIHLSPQQIIDLAVEAGVIESKKADQKALHEDVEGGTVFIPATQYRGKEAIIPIVIEGKRTFWQVGNQRLLDLLTGASDNKVSSSVIERASERLLGLTRLGATAWNVSFSLISNPIRDTLSAYVYGDYSRTWPIYSTVSGMIKVLRNKPEVELYKAMGLQMDTRVTHDLDGAKRLSADAMVSMIEKNRREDMPLLSRAIGKFKADYLMAKLRGGSEILGLPEIGTRMFEFNAARNYWLDRTDGDETAASIMGALASGDISVNFRRGGTIARGFMRHVLFFNAGVQSLDKFARAIGLAKALPFERVKSRRKKLARTLIRSGQLFTSFCILSYLRNRDEDWWINLPAHEKWRYMHFRIPGKETVIRIPLPFEVGVLFGAMPVAVLEEARTPGSIKECMSVFASTLPIQLGGLHETARNITAIAPVVDIIANERWTGAPVVPVDIKKNRLPVDWYTPQTGAIAKMWGRLIWPAVEGTTMEELAAPAYFEYILNSYTGGLYKTLTEPVDAISGEKSRVDKGPHTYPMIGRLVLSPYSDRRISDLYSAREKLRRRVGSGRATLDEIGRLRYLDRAADRISEGTRQQQDILGDESIPIAERMSRSNEIRSEGLDLITRTLERSDADNRQAGIRATVYRLTDRNADQQKIDAAAKLLTGIDMKDLMVALREECKSRGQSITMQSHSGELSTYGKRVKLLKQRIGREN